MERPIVVVDCQRRTKSKRLSARLGRKVVTTRMATFGACLLHEEETMARAEITFPNPKHRQVWRREGALPVPVAVATQAG